VLARVEVIAKTHAFNYFFWHDKTVSPLATFLDVTKKRSYVL